MDAGIPSWKSLEKLDLDRWEFMQSCSAFLTKSLGEKERERESKKFFTWRQWLPHLPHAGYRHFLSSRHLYQCT